MQFYHPQVLFALILLIIPILVHLFQLRKFKKEYFTNVKFLKKLTQQTRKSSIIKKWLVLSSRLLALSSIILAFAQPYFPSEIKNEGNVETVIYLDNSYSMEAVGKKGKLLERSIQELLESNYLNKKISLFTNSEEYSEISKEELQNISYSGNQLDFKTVFLKAQNKFSSDSATIKKVLLISDFQQRLNDDVLSLSPSEFKIYTYSQVAERKENMRIDTAYISSVTIDAKILNTILSNSSNKGQNLAVSLYNNDDLIGKTSVTLEPNSSEKITFPINDLEITKGKIQIEDNSLLFDNTLYFSLNRMEPIKVSSISQENTGFLKRIYTAPEFEYASLQANSINYNTLNESDVIILNELPELSDVLYSTLLKMIKENKVLILIPSEENVGKNFKSLVRNLGVSGFENKQVQEKLITNIKFQHPLYKGVFEKEVQNFEYPKTQFNYNLNSNSNTILSLQDNQVFLVKAQNSFIFSAPINSQNSNFIQSQLVVPTFYKMAISNVGTPSLFNYLGTENKIIVPTSVKNDEILKLTSEKNSFIPQQRNYNGSIEITTNEYPQTPDNYLVELNNIPQVGLSFNIDRAESNLLNLDLNNTENIEKIEDLNEFFISEGYLTEKNTFWKWFVTFALLFLLVETLLLKYYK